MVLDRGLYSHEVYMESNNRELLYTTPVPKYEDEYEAIKQVESRGGADTAVNHDAPLAVDTEIDTTDDFLYVPATADDAAAITPCL